MIRIRMSEFLFIDVR